MSDDRRWVAGDTESVASLFKFVETTDVAVFLVQWTLDKSYEELVTGFGPLEPSAQSESGPERVEIHVLGVSEGTVQVPTEALTCVEPVRDAEAVANALPVEAAARARVLRSLAEHDTNLVDVAAVLLLFESTDAGVLSDALASLAFVAADHPEDCTVAIPALVDFVEEASESARRVEGLACLANVASGCPEAVAPFIPSVLPLLATSASDELRAVVSCVALVAATDPDLVADGTADLAALLDNGDGRVQTHAAYALCQVAADNAEQVRPHVESLVSVVAAEDLDVATRLNATSAVGQVGGKWPDAVVDHLSTFVAALDAADPRLRANAVGVLSDVATVHTLDVEPYTPILAKLLGDEDSYCRVNASAALARVADDLPEAVIPHVDAFLTCLEDEEPFVRENACWALGYLRDDAETARPRLEQLSVDDTEATVRERARWALDAVDGGVQTES